MHTLDHIAEETIRASMRMAAAEGAGLGMGGMFTVLPDLGILAAITMRMIQKLSLIYGFPYNTEQEEAELWVAAASAAGVDIGREIVEKQVVSKFVPRVIQRIAVRTSAEIVEKWTARLIPVVSGAIGAGLNYYFVRVWGERALGHFRQRHLAARQQHERAATRVEISLNRERVVVRIHRSVTETRNIQYDDQNNRSPVLVRINVLIADALGMGVGWYACFVLRRPSRGTAALSDAALAMAIAIAAAYLFGVMDSQRHL